MKLLSKITAFFILLSITQVADAQSVFNKGENTIQVGFGLGASFASGSLNIPPLQVRYERAVTDRLSVGGILGYSSSTYKYDDYDVNYNTGAMISKKSSIDYSYLLVGLRGNYHFETEESKFDPYLGLTLGYNNVSVGESTYNIEVKSSAAILGAQFGSNYYFSERLGAWAEVGYGLGYLNLGITFKF